MKNERVRTFCRLVTERFLKFLFNAECTILKGKQNCSLLSAQNYVLVELFNVAQYSNFCQSLLFGQCLKIIMGDD
jgi:hypothetical protein